MIRCVPSRVICVTSSASSTSVTVIQSIITGRELADLAGLAYDSASDLLLAMFDSSDRIHVIDRNGQLITRWTVPGVEQEGIIFVDGNFFVADDALGTITRFERLEFLAN
ncbi:MAG: SdiA-regulated domain-containing protein [Pirellulales bacterium]